MKMLITNTFAFEKEIARLNKRAAKIGINPITFIKGEKTTATRTSIFVMDGEESERSYPVTVFPYEITLPAFEDYRWQLVATITPVEQGPTRSFVDAHVSNFDTKKWEQVDPCKCDHCHASRTRNLTYVVQNKDSAQQLQVGRQCFKDYVGHEGLIKLEFQALLVTMFKDGEDFGGSGGSSGIHLIGVRDVIKAAEALKELSGSWMYNDKDEYSGEIVADGTHRQAAKFIKGQYNVALSEFITKNDSRLTAEADLAIEQIKEIDFNGEDEEFGRTLQYCANFEFVPASKASLVAYAGQFLRNRAARAAREAAKATMQHVGTIGKREDFKNLTVKRVAQVASQFGTLYINTFSDESGNEIVWKTSSYCAKEGAKVSLKGTVKAHSEWNGAKQTELSRCKEI